jgi:hypothetical protein
MPVEKNVHPVHIKELAKYANRYQPTGKPVDFLFSLFLSFSFFVLCSTPLVSFLPYSPFLIAMLLSSARTGAFLSFCQGRTRKTRK